MYWKGKYEGLEADYLKLQENYKSLQTSYQNLTVTNQTGNLQDFKRIEE